jgi:hypothetical protein
MARDPNGVWVDATTAMVAPQITGFVAGADIAAGMPCYIKSLDNLVYQSDGTAAAEPSKVDGFSAKAAKQGQPVTLYGIGARYHYSAPGTLLPGADLYLDVGGGLTTAPTTGGLIKIARALDDTDIQVRAYE